jgi:hypothetical protein
MSNTMNRDASGNPRNNRFASGNNFDRVPRSDAAGKAPPPPPPREAVGAAAVPKPVPKPAPRPPAPVYRAPPTYYAPSVYVAPAPAVRVGAAGAWDSTKNWWEQRTVAQKIGIGVAGVGVPLLLIIIAAAAGGDSGASEMDADEIDALEKEIGTFARETRAEIRRLDAAMDQTEVALEKEEGA